MDINPITREFKVSLTELFMPDGISVAKKLEDINKRVLELGQEFCILRQNNTPITTDMLEDFECACWRLMNQIEEITGQ